MNHNLYLRISAVDPYKLGLQNILINLDTDTIESGTIIRYENMEEVDSSSIQEYVQFFDTIFAKVVDLGVYEIICDDMIIIRDEGYVPDYVDEKYNQEPGYGDYIDFRIDINCKLMAKKEELFNLLIASLISADNNYDQESRLKNIGKLTVLRSRFENDPKRLDFIDKGIQLLQKEYEQWEH